MPFPGLPSKAKRGTGRTRKVRAVSTLIRDSRRIPPGQKAAFHDVSGAGASRVLRPFLGITPDDEAAILDRFEAGLDRMLKEQQ